MGDQFDTPKNCECHMMEALAEVPGYSVTHDSDRNIFYLNGKLSIAHCIFCGGRLPTPQYDRGSIHADPDEEREALDAVASAGSLEELKGGLGPPDEIQLNDAGEFMTAFHKLAAKYPDIYDDDPDHQWTRLFRYAKRWKTLCLDVYEFPDGRLEPGVMPLRPNEFVIIEPRPWWRRFLPRVK